MVIHKEFAMHMLALDCLLGVGILKSLLYIRVVYSSVTSIRV
jgi:hypothetical protein